VSTLRLGVFVAAVLSLIVIAGVVFTGKGEPPVSARVLGVVKESSELQIGVEISNRTQRAYFALPVEARDDAQQRLPTLVSHHNGVVQLGASATTTLIGVKIAPFNSAKNRQKLRILFEVESPRTGLGKLRAQVWRCLSTGDFSFRPAPSDSWYRAGSISTDSFTVP